MTVTDANACKETDSIMVTQPPLPQPAFATTQPSCFGYRDGRVEIRGNDLEVYTFSLDGERFQRERSFEGLPAGDYETVLKDTTGCVYDYPFTIDSPPEQFIEAYKDQTIKLGESATLRVESQFPLDSLRWLSGEGIDCDTCQNTTVRPMTSQVYPVSVVSQKGCYNEDRVFIKVNRRDLVYPPNAFSPNGDGRNDYFTLYSGSGASRIEELRIFNRWGVQVFSAENIPFGVESMGWDGVFKGERMNNGVFVYYARVRLVDGTEEMVKGEIHLIR